MHVAGANPQLGVIRCKEVFYFCTKSPGLLSLHLPGLSGIVLGGDTHHEARRAALRDAVDASSTTHEVAGLLVQWLPIL